MDPDGHTRDVDFIAANPLTLELFAPAAEAAVLKSRFEPLAEPQIMKKRFNVLV